MLNHIEIMGNLVADPELKTTGSGIKVCSFHVACERDYAANGAQKETDFVDCVAWREKAEFVCKYFAKGDADPRIRPSSDEKMGRPLRRQTRIRRDSSRKRLFRRRGEKTRHGGDNARLGNKGRERRSLRRRLGRRRGRAAILIKDTCETAK